MLDTLKSWFGMDPPGQIVRIEPKIGNLTDYVDVPSSDQVRMGEIFAQVPTSAGAQVNELSAMRVSAAYACGRLIAGAMASLPLPIYKRTKDGRKVVPIHPMARFLNDEPTPRFSAATFWEFITHQVLFRGDGLAYVVRPNQYAPGVTAIVPVPRNNWTVKRNGDRLTYYIEDIDQDSGESKYFTADQDDVLHFPGFGFDGRQSKSVIAWAARQAIGTALKADEFAGSFFGNGAGIQYALKAPKAMTSQQQSDFRDAWIAKRAGMGITQTPLILTEGLEIQELSMTAQDAQLLESRKFQVIDIARAFGVPPFMIGETEKTSSWGSGLESMGVGFVTYTLQPHITRFEQELNRKLFSGSSFYTEFDVRGLERGDTAARANYNKAALGGTQFPGWRTQNEIRHEENLPPIKGGDTLFSPVPPLGGSNGQPDPADPEAGAADAGKPAEAA